MNIAAFQFCPAFLDVEANLAQLTTALASSGAELAVLPELCTTGYFFESLRELHGYSETCDGRTVTTFREIAREKRMIVVAGFPERDGEHVFNSAVIAFPDASFQVYRKIHLFGAEKTMFTPGDRSFHVAEWAGVKIGLMICYDWRFPESVRTLALKGAQIIVHPSDLVAAPQLWQPVMRVRSFENRVFIVTADRNGAERRGDAELVFHGCSQITDANGKVLAEADEEFNGWISAEIDPAKADNKRFSEWNDIFADRRPGMYEM
jgi:predicted amidohydrolase